MGDFTTTVAVPWVKTMEYILLGILISSLGFSCFDESNAVLWLEHEAQHQGDHFQEVFCFKHILGGFTYDKII